MVHVEGQASVAFMMKHVRVGTAKKAAKVMACTDCTLRYRDPRVCRSKCWRTLNIANYTNWAI